MNTLLWIAQGLLGLMFLTAGVMKTTQPKEKLANMDWTARKPDALIKLIGIAELLISFGLVLPVLTGIAPILTPVAAVALCIIMVLAAADHFKAKEMKAIFFNVFIFALSAFIARGRF